MRFAWLLSLLVACGAAPTGGDDAGSASGGGGSAATGGSGGGATGGSGGSGGGAASAGGGTAGGTAGGSASGGGTAGGSPACQTGCITLPINRGAPVYANFNAGPGTDGAANASDADYDTFWGSYGSSLPTTPAELAYDLSSVPAARRKTVSVLVHFREASWSYDYRPGGASSEAAGWVIEASTAPGGALPTSGWQLKATLSGNTLRSREQRVDLSDATYNWVRLRFTTGADGATFVKLNVDVFDASGPSKDSWLLLGDSISAFFMRQEGSGYTGGAVAGLKSISQLVRAGNAATHTGGDVVSFAASPELYPPVHGGGFGGWTTSDYLDATKLDYGAQTPFDHFLSIFPGKYVCVGLGTNDIGQGLVASGVAIANFRTMAQKITAAGKVPCFPHVPWAPRTDVQTDGATLNAQLDALLAMTPGAVRGPDFFSLFQAHPALLADGLHPGDEGIRMMRLAWAKAISAHLAGP